MDLPSSWTFSVIGKAAVISSGVGFPVELQGRTSGKYPLAKVRDISRSVLHCNGHLDSADHYIDEADLEILRAKPLSIGSVVFAKIGEGLRLNRRAITTRPLVLDNNCMALTARKGVTCPGYLFWFMRTVDLSPLAVATSVPSVRRSDVETIPLPLPPLAEQRRIVARIEALFARTRRARADLERIAPLSRRYVEAVTERAFASDHKAGWSVSTAGELCEIKSGLTLGKRYASDMELVDRPYLRVANVQRGYLRLDEIKTVRLSTAEASRLTLRDGDILMNEGGDRDKLGRGWVWEDQIPECVHQNHVFRLRLRSPVVTPKFVSRYANHAGARYFLDEGKQTTNLASISMSKVAALPIPVPPMGEAAVIDTLLDETDRSTQTLQADADRALALLDRFEQSILARAFRGELVSQDPAEAAAAVPDSVEPTASRRRVRALA